MKAKDFLKLVDRMITTQQNYFNKGRLQRDLVQAKALEKDVMAIIKIGKLDPDEPKPVYSNLDLFGGANFCIWSRDEDHDRWETTCKQIFETFAGGLEKNNFTFCPNCGKQIHEHTLVTGD